MKLVYSPQFNADLVEIADYIATDNPLRAYSFAFELRDRCRILLTAPESGVRRDDIVLGFRSLPYGRYLIFYTVDDKQIRIERVLHAARDIGAIFHT